jgi:Signal peptidase, peptidase S26
VLAHVLQERDYGEIARELRCSESVVRKRVRRRVCWLACPLIQATVVKPYRIPSSSMVPTLEVDQRILVNRLDTK